MAVISQSIVQATGVLDADQKGRGGEGGERSGVGEEPPSLSLSLSLSLSFCLSLSLSLSLALSFSLALSSSCARTALEPLVLGVDLGRGLHQVVRLRAFPHLGHHPGVRRRRRGARRGGGHGRLARRRPGGGGPLAGPTATGAGPLPFAAPAALEPQRPGGAKIFGGVVGDPTQQVLAIRRLVLKTLIGHTIGLQSDYNRITIGLQSDYKRITSTNQHTLSTGTNQRIKHGACGVYKAEKHVGNGPKK